MDRRRSVARSPSPSAASAAASPSSSRSSSAAGSNRNGSYASSSRSASTGPESCESSPSRTARGIAWCRSAPSSDRSRSRIRRRRRWTFRDSSTTNRAIQARKSATSTPTRNRCHAAARAPWSASSASALRFASRFASTTSPPPVRREPPHELVASSIQATPLKSVACVLSFPRRRRRRRAERGESLRVEPGRHQDPALTPQDDLEVRGRNVERGVAHVDREEGGPSLQSPRARSFPAASPREGGPALTSDNYFSPQRQLFLPTQAMGRSVLFRGSRCTPGPT